MRKKALALTFAITAGCCVAKTVAAQSPAMHIGTFPIGAPEHCGGQTWCGHVGERAMAAEGLSINRFGNFLLFGAGNNVTMAMICTPVGNEARAAVIASSLDNASAERFRNVVRQRMQTTGCL